MKLASEKNVSPSNEDEKRNGKPIDYDKWNKIDYDSMLSSDQPSKLKKNGLTAEQLLHHRAQVEEYAQHKKKLEYLKAKQLAAERKFVTVERQYKRSSNVANGIAAVVCLLALAYHCYYIYW